MMNIAVFCAYFYPHNGGVEKYVQNLFSGIKDVHVTIITSNSDNAAKFERKFGMDIYRFKCWNIMGKAYPVIRPSEYKNIEKIFKDNTGEKKFDYIITQTRFFNTSLIGCHIARKFRIPLIHFEHGTQHSPIKNPLMHLFGTWYDHIFGRYIIKNSVKCIGISHASERFIKHLYPKAKTSCIYNSVDMKTISAAAKITSKEKRIMKKSLGIKDEKIIMYTGRIIYAKGIQDLLEAAKDIPDVKVLIMGDGNHLLTLKRDYPWAIFNTDTRWEKIMKHIGICDVFVNPSYAEGLPTLVLEAGALGVPVIATDVGGTREIIDDGKDGYIIKPKDVKTLNLRIITLLSDKKKGRQFSIDLKLKIHKLFSWNNSKKILVKSLQKVSQ